MEQKAACLVRAGFSHSDIAKTFPICKTTIWRFKIMVNKCKDISDRHRSRRPIKLKPETAKKAVLENQKMKNLAKKRSVSCFYGAQCSKKS
uniref:Uncharacterized protein n=1 Tax=Lepeophtheirus salmonis TaxID=72036 RepID=A0A0K2TF97_LEPSM